MTQVRIELNRAGIGQWLREQKQNQKMMEMLEGEGRKLAKRAGPGFAVTRMERRRNRPGVAVHPETREAKAAQSKENRLGRALGGGK